MRILAIDQSANSTGVATIDDDGKVQVSTIIPKKLRGGARLAFIYDTLVEKIKEFKPDIVCREEFAFAGNGRVFLLGMVGGMVDLAAFKQGAPCIEVSIGTHKKFSTGMGNSKKEFMILKMFQKYGIECSTDDEADALSMAKTIEGTFKYVLHGDGDLSKRDLECLTIIKKTIMEVCPKVLDKLKSTMIK